MELNRYAYAMGNPVNASDPSGNQAQGVALPSQSASQGNSSGGNEYSAAIGNSINAFVRANHAYWTLTHVLAGSLLVIFVVALLASAFNPEFGRTVRETVEGSDAADAQALQRTLSDAGRAISDYRSLEGVQSQVQVNAQTDAQTSTNTSTNPSTRPLVLVFGAGGGSYGLDQLTSVVLAFLPRGYDVISVDAENIRHLPPGVSHIVATYQTLSLATLAERQADVIISFFPNPGAELAIITAASVVLKQNGVLYSIFGDGPDDQNSAISMVQGLRATVFSVISPYTPRSELLSRVAMGNNPFGLTGFGSVQTRDPIYDVCAFKGSVMFASNVCSGYFAGRP